MLCCVFQGLGSVSWCCLVSVIAEPWFSKLQGLIHTGCKNSWTLAPLTFNEKYCGNLSSLWGIHNVTFYVSPFSIWLNTPVPWTSKFHFIPKLHLKPCYLLTVSFLLPVFTYFSGLFTLIGVISSCIFGQDKLRVLLFWHLPNLLFSPCLLFFLSFLVIFYFFFPFYSVNFILKFFLFLFFVL